MVLQSRMAEGRNTELTTIQSVTERLILISVSESLSIRILNYIISSESYFICPSLNVLVIMDDNSIRFMEYCGI